MTAEIAPDSETTALSAALGNQYQVVRLLGRGGMGAVYQAHELFLDRDVAVKVLPPHLASGDARDRFLREARTAAKLSHPNIVPLYSFGEAQNLLYYVMGLVEGESLEAKLRRQGRLSFDEARRVTTEIADALDYAHQRGIVHRDVKPDNILIERDSGRALLADFGIAKQRLGGETLTQTGIVVGTPHYMAPEQASGDRDLDGRADIYALGVITYRMVAGRLPFEGDEFHAVLAQHATRLPHPLQFAAPGVPLDLTSAVDRALEKDPARRWPTAGMLRQALSADSEEFTPDALRSISGMGVRMLVTSLALGETVLAGVPLGFIDARLAWALSLIALGIQFVSPLAMLGPARRFGWKAALGAWFRQPTWWTTWWPRVGRQTGDVWDRLPAVVRSVRNATWITSGSGLLFFDVLFFIARPDFVAAHPWVLHRAVMLPAFGAWFVVLFAPTIAALFRFARWRKEQGLSQLDGTRMQSEPTFSRAFWNRADIAPLLETAGVLPATAAGGLRAPRELMRQMADLAHAERGAVNADVYREAAAVAEEVCAAIERCDEEITRLRRDVDPDQRRRVQASLDALGPARDNDRIGIDDMRGLLRSQLDALRDVDAQHAAVEQRRARLAEQLRTLALQLAQLRAAAERSGTPDDVSSRIRALRRSIEQRVEAQGEADQLLV